MIIITNPHFSQYRVSRDSLPTQSSNLDPNWLSFVIYLVLLMHQFQKHHLVKPMQRGGGTAVQNMNDYHTNLVLN